MSQPPSFSLGQCVACEGILFLQTRVLKRLLPSVEGCHSVHISSALREFASHSHDKPEPVLHVVLFRARQQPLPINVGMVQQHPRQRFYDARFNVSGSENAENDFRWVQRAVRAHVLKTWISQCAQCASASVG
jgi:hypothetical protein